MRCSTARLIVAAVLAAVPILGLVACVTDSAQESAPVAAPPTADTGAADEASQAAAVVEAEKSVEQTVGLVRKFTRERAEGSVVRALSTGRQAVAACDTLIIEKLPKLDGYGESPRASNMVLQCGMLAAAVIGLEKDQTLPPEVDDIADQIEETWRTTEK